MPSPSRTNNNPQSREHIETTNELASLPTLWSIRTGGKKSVVAYCFDKFLGFLFVSTLRGRGKEHSVHRENGGKTCEEKRLLNEICVCIFGQISNRV